MSRRFATRGRGNLFARVVVETAVGLTEEQKSLLRKLDESVAAGGDKHNPRANSWLDTVKRFFDKISP